MTSKQKRMLAQIAVGAVLFAAAILLPDIWYIKPIAFIAAYLAVGYKVLLNAIRNIISGQIFDENFLMSIASLGAFCIGEYAEAVAVMLFYQVGALFESFAVAKGRRSIADLMDLRPDYAKIERCGQVVTLSPEEVAVGDIIVVSAGEKIPLDGIVVEGETSVDTASLTGESIPRSITVGDAVLGGFVNLIGSVKIRAEREYDNCAAARILDMVENAAEKKTRTESFITKFARYYTPAVVAAAVLLAVIPPIVSDSGFSSWIHRALTFLVVSCPCALVISVPLTFFSGIGGGSKKGVLIKGSNYFEGLSKASTVVFDKTGTLTEGSFAVRQVESSIDKAELLRLAASAEKYSTHPLAKAVRSAAGEVPAEVSEVREIAGMGVCARVDGEEIFVGNKKLMQSVSAQPPEREVDGTPIFVARQGEYFGCITVSDKIRDGAVQTVADLRKMGIRTVMLTGDNNAAAQKTAEAVGVDEYYGGLLPNDKVSHIERLIEQSEKGSVLFVGDGINDAPVLTRADVGIAMGGIGSDAATEAADAVIMNDDVGKVHTAISLSRKTLKIARQNIVLVLSIKAVVLLLGALGITGMWSAVFADVGVSVLAILNAVRAGKL